MAVKFADISSEKIKRSFLEVWNQYEVLHPYELILQQKRVKKTTMQAQPLISLPSIFTGLKRYKIKLGIYVSHSEQVRVDEAPIEVLKGWFAHELGHLVDYVPYSNFKMIKYGLQYVFSENFKRKAEHQADFHAIKHGFRAEILATKRWILNHDLVAQHYKDKHNKYYFSEKQVQLCNSEAPILQLAFETD